MGRASCVPYMLRPASSVRARGPVEEVRSQLQRVPPSRAVTSAGRSSCRGAARLGVSIPSGCLRVRASCASCASLPRAWCSPRKSSRPCCITPCPRRDGASRVVGYM
ncbi:hypothetical protein BC826DRAFT_1037293, partial [Russula brevipes]